ncbi:unnamed protein product, partial [Phaeothamnion confervicola]
AAVAAARRSRLFARARPPRHWHWQSHRDWRRAGGHRCGRTVWCPTYMPWGSGTGSRPCARTASRTGRAAGRTAWASTRSGRRRWCWLRCSARASSARAAPHGSSGSSAWRRSGGAPAARARVAAAARAR